MRKAPTVFLVLFFVLLPASALAQTSGPEEGLWFARSEAGQIDIKLYFFWSATCPHCARARPHMAALDEAYGWLSLESREVSSSQENLLLFARLAASLGEEIRGVPTMFVCGRSFVGFDQEGRTARLVENVARQCHAAILASARLPAGETATSAEFAAPFFGSFDAADLSLPILTLVLGALDAFNPCAFFVLLFLLSLLVHARSRLRMAIIGGLFVASSGLLYFLFMAAWLNLFLLLEQSRGVTLIAGLLAVCLALINIKDFYFFRQGVSLSIPEGAKPGLFKRMRGLISVESIPALVAGTLMLSFAANSYELLCTSGLPMVFTRALTLHDLPPLTYYLYLAAYNAVYVLPLIVIVALFTLTLGSRKLSEMQGRALKLLSGLMMLGLGLVLLLAPPLLDNALTALLLFVVAVILTSIAMTLDRRWPGSASP